MSPIAAEPLQLPESIPQTPTLTDLRKDYQSGDLLVLAGAGLGAAAGLPDWPGLVRRLLERMREYRVSPEAIREVENELSQHRYIDALTAAKQALGAPDFGTAVEQALDDRDLPLPDIVQSIATLKPKLRGVLTTNLDHLLERALSWYPLTRPVADIARRKKHIFKLHGTLMERDTWIFSREQYNQAVFASPELQAAFATLYRAFPILFIGFGLADDNLDQTIRAVSAQAKGQPPTHYAIVPAPLGDTRRTTLQAAGIRPIVYPNQDGTHSEVPAIVRWLAA